MAGKTRYQRRYEVTYRSRHVGKTMPKVGSSPSVGKPGDLVSYFDGGQHTRKIAKVTADAIHTEPLMEGDKARQLKFADVYEIMRDNGPQPKDDPIPEPKPAATPAPKPKRKRKAKPTPKPEPVAPAPPKAKPVPKPKRKRKPKVKPVADAVTDQDLDDWLGRLK